MHFIRILRRFFIGLFIGKSNRIRPIPRREKASTRRLEVESGDLPRAKVGKVLDGDTVDVFQSGEKIRIRLYAIDCPEDGQTWGETAKAGLIKLIGGRNVYLETYGTDDYGRTLATLHLKKGSELINVNKRMVMLGHAWVYRRYYKQLSRSRQIELNTVEDWARSKRVGLWRLENPTPPWRWRKNG